MCEALRELMKEEIDEEIDKTQLASIKSLMKKMKLTAEQAMDAITFRPPTKKDILLCFKSSRGYLAVAPYFNFMTYNSNVKNRHNAIMQ